jgi:Flp pilus assembly protein TadD
VFVVVALLAATLPCRCLAGPVPGTLQVVAANESGRPELAWIPVAALAAVGWSLEPTGWVLSDPGRGGAPAGREIPRLSIRLVAEGDAQVIRMLISGTDGAGARLGAFKLDRGVAAALAEIPAFVASAMPPAQSGRIRTEPISRSDEALAAFAAAGVERDAGRARAGLLEALRLDPDFMLARWRVAMDSFRRGDYAAAAADFRRFSDRYDEDPAALNNLGMSLLRSGRPEESLAPLRSALNLSGGSQGIRFNLARALVRAGRLGEAGPEYGSLAAALPGDARVPLERAVLRLLQGDPVGALEGVSTAATAEGAEYLASLARGAWEEGYAAYARAGYQLACAADPGHFRSRLSLGIIRYRETDYAGAVRELEEALRLRDDDAVLHRYLGLAYRASGRAAEAEAHQQRADGIDGRATRRAPPGGGEEPTGVTDAGGVVEAGSAPPAGVPPAGGDPAEVRRLQKRIEHLEEELQRLRGSGTQPPPVDRQ